MKLSEIIHFLEEIAPLRFQESYDNAGLIVGDRDQEVKGAVISLDATEEVIDEAISTGCNLVVSHHPIVFKGIKKFEHSHYVNRAVIKAIKNDVALYAIHTNLDNVLQNGVNAKIGQRLGLKGLTILKAHPNAHRETAYELGSGALGTLNEELSGSEFIHLLKSKLNLSVVKHTKLIDRPVQRIAVCGGSGSFLLPMAIAANADVFVTSDFKYHEFFEADGNLMICDVGHYESEYFTIELLYELISKKFPNFAAHYTKVITNPVFYS